MTTITVVVVKQTGTLASGVVFAGTSVAVKDNSGAVLPAKLLKGTENPAWTAVFIGAVGPNEAQATITDLDSNGNPIGTPIVLTETGTGGQPQNFSQSVAAGSSITVV